MMNPQEYWRVFQRGGIGAKQNADGAAEQDDQRGDDHAPHEVDKNAGAEIEF